MRCLARIPSLCAICRGWGSTRVCLPCMQRFAPGEPRCGRCALRVPAGTATCGRCLVSPPLFQHAVAAVDYGFPWDRLVLGFKFHGALDLAGTLAGGLRDAVARTRHPPPDLLLPVPLSPARLRERGFNQAWELARRLGPAADPTLLLRVKHTPHQIALPEARRATNVRGAFAIEPRRRAAVAGRHVAVVDDVMTTGATAHEITTVLQAAGAASVQVWVVARTPRPSD